MFTITQNKRQLATVATVEQANHYIHEQADKIYCKALRAVGLCVVDEKARKTRAVVEVAYIVRSCFGGSQTIARIQITGDGVDFLEVKENGGWRVEIVTKQEKEAKKAEALQMPGVVLVYSEESI